MIDKRKLRAQQDVVKKEKAKLMKEPMNVFLNTRTEDDSDYKYKTAELFRNEFSSKSEEIYQEMRLVQAYIEEIRESKFYVNKLQQELDSGKITTKHKDGHVMDPVELKIELMTHKIKIHSNVAHLKFKLKDKILTKVGDDLTYEMFDNYVLKCIELIKNEGLELFPKSFKPLMPE